MSSISLLTVLNFFNGKKKKQEIQDVMIHAQ